MPDAEARPRRAKGYSSMAGTRGTNNGNDNRTAPHFQLDNFLNR